MRRSIFASVLSVVFLGVLNPAFASDRPLKDTNGDGQIEVLAFGDSITYGVGDGASPGAYVPDITESGSPRGYPVRLSALLGVPVYNAGVPGEELCTDGVERFPNLVVNSSVDVVIIKEGTNDTQRFVTTRTLSANLQRVINVARAEGKSVVLATLVPPTGDHAQFAGFSAVYSSAIRNVATSNSLPLADIEQAFFQVCPELTTCSLYNLPEGLHPNTAGYDMMTETIAAALGSK